MNPSTSHKLKCKRAELVLNVINTAAAAAQAELAKFDLESEHAMKPRELGLQAVVIKKEELDLVKTTTVSEDGILTHQSAADQTSSASQPIDLCSEDEDEVMG
jgi:hypothetical protein